VLQVSVPIIFPTFNEIGTILAVEPKLKSVVNVVESRVKPDLNLDFLDFLDFLEHLDAP
jgi:hypothetical protein